MEYEYLSHTADVKVRAFGKDFGDACRSAARAITDLLADVEEIVPKHQHSVSLRAKSKEALLFDFINELIYLKDADDFVASDATLLLQQETGGWLLEGELFGDKLSLYAHSGDIKSATYHEMGIEEHRTVTVLEFVLDI